MGNKDIAVTRPRRLLSVNETMVLLGIGRTKLYQMLDSRELPSFRIGHLRKIPEDALIEYQNSQLALEYENLAIKSS